MHEPFFEMRPSAWTPLPPVPLICQGPGLVESLDHYSLRLSSLCGINRFRLMKLLRISVGIQRNPSHAVAYTGWTGPQGEYLSWLNPLIKLTGQRNLQIGTFHRVSAVLSCNGLINEKNTACRRKWCPKCYLDWDEEQSVEPLLWAFTMLGKCPLHSVVMEDRCKHCKSVQSINREYDVRRICSTCKSPLGHGGDYTELGAFQRWVDATLVDFIEFVSAEEEIVPRTNLLKLCERLGSKTNGRLKLPPAIRNYVESFRSIYKSKQGATPSISQYLNLAAFLGMSIEDMLMTPEECWSDSLFDRSLGFTSVPFVNRRLKENVAEVGSCMDELLKTANILLPPMTMLCREFDVWVSTTREYWPHLHQIYRDKQRSQTGTFTCAHERRAFNFTIHRAKRVFGTEFWEDKSKLIPMEVAEAANVELDLASACFDSIIVILRNRNTCANNSERTANFDVAAEHWISGRF